MYMTLQLTSLSLNTCLSLISLETLLVYWCAAVFCDYMNSAFFGNFLFLMCELNLTHMHNLLLQRSVACGWVLCLLVAFGTIFTTYPTFTGHTFGTAGNVLYGCLRHVSWAAAMSWLIYCCCHHYAGVVFDILFTYRTTFIN